MATLIENAKISTPSHEVENDYDRIANEMTKILAGMIGESHEPRNSTSDSITIRKDGFISTVIRIQRLQDYVSGLAKSRRAYRDGIDNAHKLCNN